MKRRPYLICLSLCLVLMAMVIWFNSGTLAPYAATLEKPRHDPVTGYIHNIDYQHHMAGLRLLEGGPVPEWESSVVLRRMLYPVLLFPFYLTFGELGGGLALNLLLHAGALLALSRFLYLRHGPVASIVGSALIATYPGMAYWAGLPYAYALIVPGTIACYILLELLSSCENTSLAAYYALGMGLVFTGYDLFPFFLPAAVLLLAWRKKWIWIPMVTVLMLVPLFIVMSWQRALGIPLSNDNTGIFTVVLKSWFHWHDVKVWFWLLKTSPVVFLHNFFYSNFVVLPVAVLVLFATGRSKRGWTRSLSCLVAAGLALWCFNNLAPPYEGWQMRGTWIARLYQPLFIVLLIPLAVQAEYLGKTGAVIVGLTLIGNISISLGGVFDVPLAGRVYHEFYRHSKVEMYQVNLDRFGRRPLGGPVVPARPVPRKETP